MAELSIGERMSLRACLARNLPPTRFVWRTAAKIAVRYIAARVVWCASGAWMSVRGKQHQDRRRQVLLVANNIITLEYAKTYRDFLEAHSAELQVTILLTPSLRRAASLFPALGEARTVGLTAALMRRWNVALFFAHGLAPYFHPSVPKIYLSHGIAGELAKSKRAEAYDFGSETILSRKRVVYDRFFVNSEIERAFAIGVNPRLAGRVAITGELRSEALLRMNRDAARHRLGLDTGRPAVLVVSTWGRRSLIEQWGDELASYLLPLASFATVVIAPHFLSTRDSRHRVILASMREKGFKVLDPAVDRLDAAAACDVAVADASSLSLYFAMLKRSIVFAPLDLSKLRQDGPVATLYGMSPVVRQPNDLLRAVRLALAMPEGQVAGRDSFLATFFPCLGHGEKLILNEILAMSAPSGPTAFEARSRIYAVGDNSH